MRVWVDDGIVLARGVIGARATQRLARPRRLDCPPSPSSPLHRHPASYHLATCDAVDGARERGDARRVSRDLRGVIRDCRRRSTLERARRSTPPRCARARGSDVARASSSRDNFVRPHPPRRRLGVATPRRSRRPDEESGGHVRASSVSETPSPRRRRRLGFLRAHRVRVHVVPFRRGLPRRARAPPVQRRPRHHGRRRRPARRRERLGRALARPRPILVPLGLRPHATPRRRPRGSLRW